ncbi:hypothetical protein CH352_00910 [Leptospira hartskeerlii]|uniref:Uncharacterized protein n=1 Tax=Leptospira hartskeerlii TaxID=2023177 RepID=A0A2M9X8I0_9LEPT|nr:hypothetical protein [Leptospira hartskeerlii]PJZ23964.1 hypothetical protein CH357_18490 [Leptospira hartskeerlii]PJZ35228.1 hypothetical protein CH352_00910 [Leptospira hartskeerlii]
MKIFGYHNHSGIFVREAQCFISIDPDLGQECSFLMLSLKHGELLKKYYDSLDPIRHDEHIHMKVAFNGLKLCDGDQYNVGLSLNDGVGNPEGFLLPLRSFDREFTYNRIAVSENPNKISKYSFAYNERVYRMILQLDSLMIHLSEKSNSIQTN